jgi:hypothetical protein
MKRLGLLVALLPLIAAQATLVAAAPHWAVLQQQQEVPPPTPLDDPYAAPAGDPDIFAPQPSDEPSPDNPQGN